MDTTKLIFKELEKSGFRVSTDTRGDLSGKVFFALKGEKFDANTFVLQALEQGASAVVTENPEYKSEKIFYVENVLQTLQECARLYREEFSIPILAIGGSNGKTTTRELVTSVLATKYQVHSSKENLNNHIGLPLTILAMPRETEIGVFEIGANHPGEHLVLLDILKPTMVLVTNNGLDHLEGFGSPEGVRSANKEIYDWARESGALAFVNKNLSDLVEDSEGLERIFYPELALEKIASAPLKFSFEDTKYETQMVGDYNLDNIYAGVALGKHFSVQIAAALSAISRYEPTNRRSQFLAVGDMKIILDCYNANPSSMMLSLESFVQSAPQPRGVVLGDMLELGSYAEVEHEKVVEYISKQSFEQTVFIGENFKKALSAYALDYQWFPNSDEARAWFQAQDFSGFTLLLKGSRGSRVEKVLGL